MLRSFGSNLPFRVRARWSIRRTEIFFGSFRWFWSRSLSFLKVWGCFGPTLISVSWSLRWLSWSFLVEWRWVRWLFPVVRCSRWWNTRPGVPASAVRSVPWDLCWPWCGCPLYPLALYFSPCRTGSVRCRLNPMKSFPWRMSLWNLCVAGIAIRVF